MLASLALSHVWLEGNRVNQVVDTWGVSFWPGESMKRIQQRALWGNSHNYIAELSPWRHSLGSTDLWSMAFRMKAFSCVQHISSERLFKCDLSPHESSLVRAEAELNLHIRPFPICSKNSTRLNHTVPFNIFYYLKVGKYQKCYWWRRNLTGTWMEGVAFPWKWPKTFSVQQHALAEGA